MLDKLRKRLSKRERQKIDRLERKAATRLVRENELLEVKKRRVEVQRALAKAERQLANYKKAELAEATEARKARDERRQAERDLKQIKRKPYVRAAKKTIRVTSASIDAAHKLGWNRAQTIEDLRAWSQGREARTLPKRKATRVSKTAARTVSKTR